MKTLATTLIILGCCAGMSASTLQHATGAPHVPPPPLGPVAFHHFHAHHRPVVFLGGGFGWYGYPYPYYGYPVAYYGDAYEKMGKQWGKDLQHGKVTVDQFVTYLRLDLLRASDVARSNFQVGFLKGYGKNGLSLFTQALSQARAGEPAPPAPNAPVPPRPSAENGPAPNEPLSAPKYQR
ncbi:MAG TPA: hypothetical protein VNT26_16615 [Candidatus Sulfotelmatobacter sp.]|nr:hypothetical protein [Candidatus Sulfotelmatobacter sp.]